MMRHLHCCLFCGPDTAARDRVWADCKGTRHEEADPAEDGGPWERHLREEEYDYSEDALGPHPAEERAAWLPTR